MRTKEELLAFLDELIAQGEGIFNWAPPNTLPVWNARLLTLQSLLGQAISPWLQVLDRKSYSNERDAVSGKSGAIRAIREAVEKDLLVGIENRVLAEALDDLLEQADCLVQSRYYLAAGVLGRAVLEKHLRKGCDRNGCLPPGRPTISTLTQALYQGQHLNKLAMKKVEAMADAGNHCAHNVQPPLTSSEVETFLRDVREFVTQQQW